MDPTLPTDVTFENILAYLLSALAAVLMAVATWGVRKTLAWLKDRWGIEIDQKYAASIDTAIWNGIGYAQALGMKHLGGLKLDIANPTVREVVRYVEKAVPDALRHHGITPERLAELVLARLGNDNLLVAPASPAG